MRNGVAAIDIVLQRKVRPKITVVRAQTNVWEIENKHDGLCRLQIVLFVVWQDGVHGEDWAVQRTIGWAQVMLAWARFNPWKCSQMS